MNWFITKFTIDDDAAGRKLLVLKKGGRAT
jgi:hypothetical protein